MSNAPRNKKRKNSELEAETSLYAGFVNAANAVSHLYAQSVQQQKRSRQEGASQALVR
jgi:hypothetical protein